MTMSREIAIVTGGAGFIGSHLVDQLVQRDFQVRIIDNLSGGRESNISHHSNNSQVHFEKLDICNIEPSNKIFNDASYVYHMAGIGDIVPSIKNPSDYMRTNVQGTVSILECARFANQGYGVKKFVYAASSSCYGIASTPTNEDHPISPQYPYALSKYQGEQAVIHWNKVYKLHTNSIRIFNAYGTRSRTSGAYGAVFGVFMRQKLANMPFTVVGDGTQRRDFLYVTDVATAFIAAALTSKNGRIWNLGSSNPQSINKLVQLLNGTIVYIPKRPAEPDCTWADISQITKDLGWKPKVTFEDGVKLILKDIEYWQDAPLWDANLISEATKDWFQAFE